MLEPIYPRDAWNLLQDGRARLVDIREPDEIAAVRAERAMPAPLSLVKLTGVPRATSEMPVIFTCHSGRRVKNNAAMLESLAAGPAYVLEGGMEAWIRACLPVVRGRRYSMERQVRMAAGGIILAGFVLSLAWKGFLILPLGVGCGLVYAGLTGSCAMAGLLARMPWNR
ncbi:MAG: rhodanese family protein [Desulfovibrionaceae bacterium]|nr:rhodanese family protein [Desulfovibrionaceae bacterium]